MWGGTVVPTERGNRGNKEGGGERCWSGLGVEGGLLWYLAIGGKGSKRGNGEGTVVPSSKGVRG